MSAKPRRSGVDRSILGAVLMHRITVVTLGAFTVSLALQQAAAQSLAATAIYRLGAYTNGLRMSLDTCPGLIRNTLLAAQLKLIDPSSPLLADSDRRMRALSECPAQERAATEAGWDEHIRPLLPTLSPTCMAALQVLHANALAHFENFSLRQGEPYASFEARALRESQAVKLESTRARSICTNGG